MEGAGDTDATTWSISKCVVYKLVLMPNYLFIPPGARAVNSLNLMLFTINF